MSRTKLKDRILPSYTRKEEVFNMVSHIVGGAFGVIALTLCVVFSALHNNTAGVVGSAIYGGSLVVLYTMSSVYHGLSKEMPKKVMQVLDHCTIYLLIGGTYTPILLSAVMRVSPAWAWVLFGIVWGLAAVGATFSAIDHKKHAKFTMACYIGMGWCVVIAAKVTLEAIPLMGIMWLLIGGISYTIGAVLYAIGKKRRYIHCVFHIFCLLGSICHFFTIFFYVI